MTPLLLLRALEFPHASTMTNAGEAKKLRLHHGAIGFA
jgi:hypothetical protein